MTTTPATSARVPPPRQPWAWRRARAATLVAAWGAVAAVAAPPPAGFTHAPADAAVVERVLRDSRVAREPPQPSLADYFGHVAERLARALAEGLGRGTAALRASGIDPRVVAWATVVLAGVALAWALVAGIIHRRAAPRRAPAVIPRAAARDDSARLVERDGWRRELEARLARGDAPAALEALWWWFARSLSGAAVERSWTSRELLARAGRLDLGALASSLDCLLYGPVRPGVEDVRRLAHRVQAALP